MDTDYLIQHGLAKLHRHVVRTAAELDPAGRARYFAAAAVTLTVITERFAQDDKAALAKPAAKG